MSIAVKHLNATTESIWILNQFCFGMDTYWFEKIKDRDQKQNSQIFCLLRNKMLSCLVAFNKEILLDRITNAIQFATSIKGSTVDFAPSFPKVCTLGRTHSWHGILLPELFWLTVRKNCSSDREKLLKFVAEGWEFAKILRSIEQFVRKVKG